MIEKENEYKNAVNCIKKWSKHWLTTSASRKYAGADSMKEPAAKTLKYISSLDDSMSFKQKLESLYGFFEESDKKERESQFMGTGFYFDLMSYIRNSYKRVENGEPVIKNINR
ncbi:hypothetical protein [Heyndrickxia camelliae]|uniref:Uncharacterized protein n=1 Tax=Heyndrickxia camelliae TaxID=1707093 RepID=A0A2N3LCP9_9BACI|nr:hypothetical protein [Heyndrickxia camelliae]PKR82398.1 hypothetical protein CWO92_24735 [Heyndrickxia camelliae]